MQTFEQPYDDFPLIRVGVYATGFLDGDLTISYSSEGWEIERVTVHYYDAKLGTHTAMADEKLAARIIQWALRRKPLCDIIAEKVDQLCSADQSAAEAADRRCDDLMEAYSI